MKNMFYNYDNNIDHKVSSKPPFRQEPCNKLDTDSRAEYLYNVKGDLLGIKVLVDTKVDLYFRFESDNEADLYNLLRNNLLSFKVLDFKYEEVVSFPVEVLENLNEAKVELITSEEGPLKQGTYRLQLTVELEDGFYTLYSPSSGILTVY